MEFLSPGLVRMMCVHNLHTCVFVLKYVVYRSNSVLYLRMIDKFVV